MPDSRNLTITPFVNVSESPTHLLLALCLNVISLRVGKHGVADQHGGTSMTCWAHVAQWQESGSFQLASQICSTTFPEFEFGTCSAYMVGGCMQVMDHVAQSQYALQLLLPQGDYAAALDIITDIQVCCCLIALQRAPTACLNAIAPNFCHDLLSSWLHEGALVLLVPD